MISLKFLLFFFSIMLVLKSCMPDHSACAQSPEGLPSLSMHFLETAKISCDNTANKHGEKIL